MIRKCRFLHFILSAVLLSIVPRMASANAVSVTNVVVTSQNTVAKTCKIQFDLSWNNSWRNRSNYDAVWVFVKYSTDAGITWNHATLKTSGINPEGFSVGSGTPLELKVPADKKGCFIQRSSDGQGTVSASALQLVWDWGSDGLTLETVARVKVFAVEMVYIPGGVLGETVPQEQRRQTAIFGMRQIRRILVRPCR